MTINYNFKVSLLVWASIFVLIGCSDSNQQIVEAEKKVIRVAVEPSHSGVKTRIKFDQLLDYLELKTDARFELVKVNSYTELIDLFVQKKIDLGYFGGVSFVIVNERAGAIPLVSRDIDTRFTSTFIINKKSNINSLLDLKEKSFSFGSRLSTSGHFMPRFFLNQKGLNPEAHFDKIIYSGTHDKTALLVQDGTVDAGVLNSKTVERMLSNGDIDTDKVAILWKTPRFFAHVWAIQPEFDEKQKAMIEDAFLELSLYQERQQSILKSMDAKYFIPISNHDFDSLKKVMNGFNR
ncbi:phosphate/phosphite/phosphonate ABC transporter substrate-binding protein [Aliikangiella coralliicola]|uniref:Phosphate/phosphite/phosphonate ABC transporter substrate-binding protein n=1 Tax=Aliikangiella coralliicola TaxID=2592383 RepID=A0A545UF11_9GAMM|nr:phosphate/phosphite/phosphonate ABC transporter substrate-binding protein [Aliikangiella coralliicola]TQV87973.1 phosphate/phosphite/phosphonate ABC transporter substrate-binding protein [Aliikangiella coralliicola]